MLTITQRKRIRRLIETIHECQYDLRPYIEGSSNKELQDHWSEMDRSFSKSARLMRLEWALSYSEEDV